MAVIVAGLGFLAVRFLGLFGVGSQVAQTEVPAKVATAEPPSPPRAAPTTATTTPTTTTTAAKPNPTVLQVTVSLQKGGHGQKIGPNKYEATTYGMVDVFFRWESQTEAGRLGSEACEVRSQVTGPGGFSDYDDSADCSGRSRSNMILKEPGTYTVTTSVIGPAGDGPVVGTATFEVFPDSTP